LHGFNLRYGSLMTSKSYGTALSIPRSRAMRASRNMNTRDW
jgi:hypothetical protein